MRNCSSPVRGWEADKESPSGVFLISPMEQIKIHNHDPKSSAEGKVMMEASLERLEMRLKIFLKSSFKYSDFFKKNTPFDLFHFVPTTTPRSYTFFLE